MRRLIYIDSNVFIAAYRGYEEDSEAAMEVINGDDFDLVSSDFLRLELLPKPSFYGRADELKFIQTLLKTATIEISASSAICQAAIAFGSKYNLLPLDSLHIAAASSAGVDEFITLEKPSKPICHVKEIKVISICGR